MNPTSKKFISLFLAFSLMAISCTTMTTQRQKRFESSKERKHGAELIITKTDGQRIKGELITVKPNSLLLLDTEGKDVSVGIADIKVIRIVKKSKALLGAGIGGTAGMLGGMITAAIFDADFYKFVNLGPVIFATSGLAIGALVGASIGSAVGRDKTIQIEGMSNLEIEEALDKLRKKAHIRDYR